MGLKVAKFGIHKTVQSVRDKTKTGAYLCIIKIRNYELGITKHAVQIIRYFPLNKAVISSESNERSNLLGFCSR